MRVLTLLLASFTCLAQFNPVDHYIIIHGTWTKPMSWHMPGGDFYEALAEHVEKKRISFYQWSGQNNNQARIKAAKELVEFIQMFYPKYLRINIIAHSHGANIANIATQFMKEEEDRYPIARIYALGAPIDNKNYYPNMRVIGEYFNFFSYNDIVQPVLCNYQRELKAHERIVNIETNIDGWQPLHRHMHSPAIARWLTTVQACINAKLNGFQDFAFNSPGKICFFSDKPPHYHKDLERHEKRERDLAILFDLRKKSMQVATIKI